MPPLDDHDLESLFRQLIVKAKSCSSRLTLDEVGEVVGDRSMTGDQIEALIVRLEAEGVEIGGDDDVDLAALLKQVIQTALSLKRRGKKSHAAAIAEEAGLSQRAVRVALLYSEVIRRG